MEQYSQITLELKEFVNLLEIGAETVIVSLELKIRAKKDLNGSLENYLLVMIINIFIHFGFNMKITDMQAACGLGQLTKLEQFIEKRKKNVNYLKNELKNIEDEILLPEAEKNSDPSWFGFPITIKENSKFKRKDLINHLTKNKIGTRLLFAGNLTKQPAYLNKNFRVESELNTTDLIMNNTFWVGIQPALGEEELSFTAKTIKNFFK